MRYLVSSLAFGHPDDCPNSISVHYHDVTMDSVASQITSLTIVYSAVYSAADQTKHQSSASLAFVRGIHRGPVNSPHKGPVTRKMFPFDDVIMNRKEYELINDRSPLRNDTKKKQKKTMQNISHETSSGCNPLIIGLGYRVVGYFSTSDLREGELYIPIKNMKWHIWHIWNSLTIRIHKYTVPKHNGASFWWLLPELLH